MLGGWAYGGNYRIQPKDKILVERGSTQAYEVLRDVLRDPHTFAVTQKRWLSVVEREWEVKPASDRAWDKKAAELVERQLKAIASYDEEIEEGGELVPNIDGGFDQICYNLLQAEHYGFRPSEIIWDTDGTEIYPKRIKDKSPGRFAYLAGTKGYRFRLLTPEEPWSGIKLPPKKFIIHTFHPEDDNPYGWGMGGRLFYPVLFKRKLAEFALVYADKFGSPTGKATYPNGRDDLKQVLLDAMNDMAQEAGIALPEGCSFEWMSVQGQGTDVYTGLMDYFDREISKAVLGETGSTDQQGTGGSRARDQVGNEVRIELTKASADFLSATLNRTLIKWITWYNFGNKANPPSVWRKFPELEQKEDLNGRAQRDNTIATMMETKPTRKYVEETYSIELEEPKEEEQDNGLAGQLGAIFNKSEGRSQNSEVTTSASLSVASDSTTASSENAVRADASTEGTSDFKILTSDFASKSAQKIINWNGLEIGVEYFPGDKRHNKILKSGYGHIRGTKGADGMALDTYFHQDVPNPDIKTSDKLYKVTQLDKDGNFDEHKYMLGYSSKNAARKAYLKQMPKSMLGGIKKVTIAQLNEREGEVSSPTLIELLKSDSVKPTQADRFAEQSIKAALPEVDKWRSQIRNEVQRINNLPLDDAAKFAQLQESLLDLYPQMDTDNYGEILASAIAAAELAGRYEVTSNE